MMTTHSGHSLTRARVLQAWALALSASLLACVQSDPTPPMATATSSARVAVQAASTEVPAARVPIPVSLERSCREICDRSRELSCSNTAQCVPNCMAMGSLTPCTDPVRALYACLVQQPVRNWECAPDGVAAIRDGFCESEQARAVTCMQAKMQ